jgi:hypothetical protein
MQMQAGFLIQAGDNQFNNVQFESRGEGRFLGGAIHLGQNNAAGGPDLFSEFMNGMVAQGSTPFAQPPVNNGYNHNQAGPGYDPYQQSPDYATLHNSMEGYPLMNESHRNAGGFGFDPYMAMQQPDPNYGMGIGMGTGMNPYASMNPGYQADAWGQPNNHNIGQADPNYNPFIAFNQPAVNAESDFNLDQGQRGQNANTNDNSARNLSGVKKAPKRLKK